jgi:thiol:disulfide interchange protein DsbC
MQNFKFLRPLTARAVCAVALATAAFSAAATPVTDALLAKLKSNYPTVGITQVNETPVTGIYEVVFAKNVLYTEANGVYFFSNMFNMQTQKSLSDDRRAELNKIDFNTLPLNEAIKSVNGTGARRIAVFADPNCGYCKQLERNLESLKNVTIYTFPVAILGPDSTAKVKAVMCASGDKAKVWNNLLVGGVKLLPKDCNAPQIAKFQNLFQTMGLQGTPAIIFESGMSLKGFGENAKIEEMMAAKK